MLTFNVQVLPISIMGAWNFLKLHKQSLGFAAICNATKREIKRKVSFKLT